MCSLQNSEFDDTDFIEKESQSIRASDLCKKCGKLQAEVVLRIKDCYCRYCFLTAATHKFRSALGKSKMVKPIDHILIAFSGSASSLSMLHMAHTGKNELNHKKFLFSTSVVYIDEGVILGMSQEERKSACENVVHIAKRFNFPIYISALSESLGINSNSKSYVTYDCYSEFFNNEKDEKLKNLFDSVKNLTQKEDLLQTLRTRLLVRISKQLRCTKIFTAETATHLSMKLLSNISLGRGAHIPLDVGFCDERDPEIKLLRPMREFMMKEITFYNVFNNLKSLCLSSLTTKAQPDASILKLTEKFVTELQEGFPATVSTILRTGDKLSMTGSFANPAHTCVLCEAPVDTTTLVSSALQAIEFSRMVSIHGPENFDIKSVGTLISISHTTDDLSLDKMNSCCGKSSVCCNKKTKSEAISLGDAEPWLCYGCRHIARSMHSLSNLPSDVVSKIHNHKRDEEIRKEIEDYLL